MKIHTFKYCFIVIAIILCVFTLQAQKVAIPISSYGTWDRGEGIDDYSDPKVDYILGIEVDDKWANIQPEASVKPDFSIFQETLDKALKYNKIVKMSINVGPESPMWIYDNGVPLVIVDPNLPKNNHLANCPYYLNQTYKDYYFNLIREFSLFLRNQPQEKFDRIAFIQVKTGATGDEEPYKGVPVDSQYLITEHQWQDFRIKAFTEFKKYFNDVSDRQIVLTFNSVDPDKRPEAYDWVMNVIDPAIGFGIKGGAYNRGHHLSDEQSYKEQWTPFLINPKGRKLFSASEMDQSWTKPIFEINTELGFYWAMLGAINTGLSSYNLAKSAITYAYTHPEIRDIYKIFNKYAQQVYPATATAAISVFHEGLNSADVVKFPVGVYGNASQGNTQRYLDICQAYHARGAKMEDLVAVTKGQVYQRESQTGYNDAGWDIAEGNYERFLTQINPDETSIGLFRVRGKIDQTSSKYDRFARSFENATGKDTMYFKFDDEMFLVSKPESLKFKIIWLDKNIGSTWALKYQTAQGIKTALEVIGIGDDTWKTETVTVTDASVDKSGVSGSDFSIINTDTNDDIFNGIEVDIERMMTSTSELWLNNKNALEIFPNPTKSNVFLKSGEDIKYAGVFDLNGKLLMEEKSPSVNYIDLSQLQKGMYFLKLSMDNGEIVKKVIKK